MVDSLSQQVPGSTFCVASWAGIFSFADREWQSWFRKLPFRRLSAIAVPHTAYNGFDEVLSAVDVAVSGSPSA